MRSLDAWSFVLIGMLLVSGCGKKEDQGAAARQPHPFVGKVVAIDPPSKQIIIAHGDMPGFIKPMTMPFVVKDTSLFRGIAVGDSVKGVLIVQRPEVWLDSLALIPTK